MTNILDLNNYEALIIDLWGVVHDGTNLYDGAYHALEHFYRENKRVIFLSNAPRRAQAAIARLDDFGIPREWYQTLITSGEVGFQALKFHAEEQGEDLHYYYLGPGKDEDVLADLACAKSTMMDEAEMIVCTGFERDFQETEDIMPTLHALHERGLPMICLNPDLEVVKQDGTHMLCAGWVAETYKELGGEVRYFGKPYGEVYDYALAILESTPEATLAIGDNLLTDIRGANHIGMNSVLLTGGILQHQPPGVGPNFPNDRSRRTADLYILWVG